MLGKEYTYYLSAIIAIMGTVGYHMLMKKIPSTVNPLVSIVSIYVAIVILSTLMLPLFLGGETLLAGLKQMTWLQAGIALCILLMEIGFLMMYRTGWDLSTGNIVTGAIINIALGFIGVFLLKEGLSPLNIAGIVLCIVGVILIGYKSSEANVQPNPSAADAIKTSSHS
jgi:drug/metabolite transporter (DMT)-like permease